MVSSSLAAAAVAEAAFSTARALFPGRAKFGMQFSESPRNRLHHQPTEQQKGNDRHRYQIIKHLYIGIKESGAFISHFLSRMRLCRAKKSGTGAYPKIQTIG
jgi:hypothetical protein